MSTEMTNRQKAIKLFSSAAICGLSLSFLLGEWIDIQAKSINLWQEDPKLIPAEYSLLKPAVEAEKLLTAKIWHELFLEYNSTPQEIANDVESPILTVNAAPINEDESKEISTIAAKTNLELKSKLNASAPTPSSVKQAQVEEILLSIHEATHELTKQSNRNGNTGAAVAENNQNVKTIIGRPLDSVIEVTNIDKSEPNAAYTASSDARPPLRHSWNLSGNIYVDKNLNSIRGHYEVGVYTRIDSEGNPIGFPIAQEILPANKKEFDLKIPNTIRQAYLFAEFIPNQGAGKKIWLAPDLNPVLATESNKHQTLIHKFEDNISTVSAANIRTYLDISGTVSTMFAKDRKLPQADVIVKVRGRKEAVRTGLDGKFNLRLPLINGTLYIEFLKKGYHPVIFPISAKSRDNLEIELPSRDAIDKLAASLGLRQISSKGVFIGQMAANHTGATAQLSLKAEGPYYFSEEGFPNSERRGTSADGRFIFFNVEPGAGYLDLQLNGDSIVPFSVSIVEGGEAAVKKISLRTGKISGRIFNTIGANSGLQPLNGARIRFEGGSELSTSDSYGAFAIGPVRFVNGEDIYLEASADKFYTHRYRLKIDEKALNKEMNLFAFPTNYINKLSASIDLILDPYAGIILGKSSGQPVRMDAMADHSPSNTAKDYYFDKKGSLIGSHNMTDPNFGTYIIFNVPKGRGLIYGNDPSGVLRSSNSISIAPSTISVLMD